MEPGEHDIVEKGQSIAKQIASLASNLLGSGLTNLAMSKEPTATSISIQ